MTSLDPATPGKYIYEPLKSVRSIRLIQVCTDSTTPQGFTVSLADYNLDEAPPFCTLSYTWHSAAVSTDGDSNPLDSGSEVDGPEASEDDPTRLSTASIKHQNGAELHITQNACDFLRFAADLGIFLHSNALESSGVNFFRQAGIETVEEMPRYLWIDAVSINQTDTSERAAQVSIMAEIYQNSHLTIAWLGKENPNAGVIETLQGFVAQLSSIAESRTVRECRNLLRGRDCFSRDAELLRLFGDADLTKWQQEWINLFSFLVARQWFYRGWIVQEAIIRDPYEGKDVVMLAGSNVIPWAKLFPFLQVLTQVDWRRDISARLRRQGKFRLATQVSKLLQTALTLSNLRAAIHDFHDDRTHSLTVQFGCQTETEITFTIMHEILRRMRYQTFSDRRDCIYGCLGLFSLARPGSSLVAIKADYQQSDVEIITSVTYDILRNMPYLDVLSQLESSQRRNLIELPSWVPDWTVAQTPTRIQQIYQTFSEKPELLNASASKCQSSTWSLHNGEVLTLPGVKLGNVVDRLPTPLLPKYRSHIAYEWFLALLNPSGGKYDLTNETREKALSRTLVANIMPPGEQGHRLPTLFTEWWTSQLIHRMRRLQNDHDADGTDSESLMEGIFQLSYPQGWMTRDAEAFFNMQDILGAGPVPENSIDRIVHRLWAQRTFFCSDKGHFGLSHFNIAVGDEVWLLQGGRTPYILRPKNDGHVVIGEAYVHGIMYGEALKTESSELMKPVKLY